MDETLADEFDDDIMSHSDDDDNNNNDDDDEQQQQQHQQRHKSPPIKRPTSIGNFHKESKKQKQHLDTFTNDHQKITHNKCENDAHRDTKMPAQHANRVANVSGRLSFNRPSLDDNNNSSNNNNTNHNNHNHIEHDFEDDDDDEEDDDDEDDADEDDEVDDEDEEEIEDDDDDDEQDMSRDVDHFAAIANNTQVNNNNNHKNAIINDDQAQELNLNINDTNNNNINNNNDDDDDEDEDDNDLGPMHDSNINSEQISPSRRHNIELRNISQQHPNNNNHRANTNNELVKQMIRLEDHLTSFGDKLKSHERRLMAIESTSQDIYIKLNHLILALESLVSQPQQQFSNNGSDINQTSHHQVNQISSALNANNSNNNNNGNQNNANNNNNNHNNSINQSSNNNNNNQTGAINNGTNATLTSLILNSASSNPNINETSTGSSRHSSASVSPSLGAQSALSTSVAASPTSQHHLNLSHLNLNHLSHQLASSIGNELAGANSAASDPNGANLSSLGGALRLANQHHQDTQSTVAAMAAASQFLSALGHLRGGGQLSHLDLTAAQSHLLASTLNVAALNASTNIHQQQSNNDMATNLSSHLLKTANQQQASNNHHIDNHLSNSSSNNNINNINSNSNNNNNNNNININSNPAGINRINSPSNQSMAQQLASLQASHNPTAAAAAAVAAQLSAAAAAAAASGNNRSLSSGGSSSSHHHHSHHNSHHSSHHHSHNPSSNSHQAHQAAVPSSNGSSAGSVSNQPPTINTSSRQQLRQQPIVHSVPHPHSHHALSYPAAAAAAASLLINSPYQTVRTKYSTRRYSRRRVGPEEAMADPSIRATVELKMPVVPKTILIVLKHRLTVQTAITLACGDTNERLRKGAIQKKLEAMFREPGAVDAFMNEWDPYKNLPVTSIQPSM